VITPKLPPALKAARAAWRACKDEKRRLALCVCWDTCRRLERLYAALPEPEGPSNADIRRRGSLERLYAALPEPEGSSDADIRRRGSLSTRHPMIKLLNDPTRGPV
jgi:hypothetical protein